jgi:hypothetical protein
MPRQGQHTTCKYATGAFRNLAPLTHIQADGTTLPVLSGACIIMLLAVQISRYTQPEKVAAGPVDKFRNAPSYIPFPPEKKPGTVQKTGIVVLLLLLQTTAT